MLFLCTYNFLNRSTAATAPPPIERALKTDVVTILPVYQTIYYWFCRYNITPYHTQWWKINYYDVLTLCTYNFLNRLTAATAPPPIKIALKTDVVTIFPVYQTMHYSFCWYNITQLEWKFINFDVLTLYRYNYPHVSTAAATPLPIKRAL